MILNLSDFIYSAVFKSYFYYSQQDYFLILLCTCVSAFPYSSFSLSVRLFETLQSLFWSVFGLLNLYVTNVKARHEVTEFVGATMFGTYNVISLVVLLNMLIAMMNNSYQLIAVSDNQHKRKSIEIYNW